MKVLILFLLLSALAAVAASQPPAEIALKARYREPSGKDPSGFVARTKTLRWEPGKTAIIICDMWDLHWCKGATGRVAEMAPVMNEVVKNARKRGVFIIHAPSETMTFYKDSPQRKLAQVAPSATPPTPSSRKEPPLPIDDSDGGCDDEPMCRNYQAWTRQHPAIEIADGDAISDNGAEVHNLLQQRGIDNVILMGVPVM